MFRLKANTIRRMTILVPLALVVATGSPAAVGATVSVSADQWAQSRTGQSITRAAGMATLVGSFKERGRERLVISYAAGDAGKLWAEELRAWLVALGVPASSVALDASAKTDDSVTISLRR